MMVLEKTLSRFNIWKWMTLLTGLCHSVGALCLRSLIWKVPTALLPYTLMIFLACSGKEITLCTSPYLLVCLQRLTFFLQLRTWWIGFSKKQYDVSFLLHYLDDFHTLGPPNSQICQRNVDTSIQQFQDWGIPLHHDKLESPSTILTVLGIELYCLLLHARLAQEKFDCIHTLLVSWSQKRHCTQKELESLIGNLQHACKVVPSGRTFLHRMINLLSPFCRENHPIRLNR